MILLRWVFFGGVKKEYVRVIMTWSIGVEIRHYFGHQIAEQQEHKQR